MDKNHVYLPSWIPWWDVMCPSPPLSANWGIDFARIGNRWCSSIVWCIVKSDDNVTIRSAGGQIWGSHTVVHGPRTCEVMSQGHSSTRKGPICQLNFPEIQPYLNQAMTVDTHLVQCVNWRKHAIRWKNSKYRHDCNATYILVWTIHEIGSSSPPTR
jgi:hypothetical protein